MSEINPKFWIAIADFASLTDADEGCDALHQCATVSRDGCKLLPDDVGLYTADQLAEAVAAERETKERAVRDVLHTAMRRFEIETVFRVIEDRLKTERTFLSPEYTLVCKGFADNLKSDFEAIRSAAK